MVRNLDAGLLAEVTAAKLAPIVLCKFEFTVATHFWSGFGEIIFAGDTYLGAGDLLVVSPIRETEDIRATGAQFQLSGVPPTLIATALGEDYQGRPASMWLGALDDSGQMAGTPYLLFKGAMDVMTFSGGGGDTGAIITLTAESRLRDLEKVKERRLTPEDQRLVSAADVGFSFVASIQDVDINWGRN